GSPSASPLGAPQNTWGQAAGQQAPKKQGSSKKKWIIIGSSGGGALIVLVVVLILVLGGGGDDDNVASPNPDPPNPAPPTVDPTKTNGTKTNGTKTNAPAQPKLKSLPFVTTFAISSDGKQMVAYHVDKARQRTGEPHLLVTLWDVATGNKVRELDSYSDFSMSPQLTFSPDGSVVLGERHNGAFRVWNVQTGKVIRDYKAQQHRNAGVGGNAISQDNQWVSVPESRGAKLVNVKTGEVRQPPKPTIGKIRYIAFSPKEPIMAISSSDLGLPEGILDLYDLRTFKKTFSMNVPQMSIGDMAFSPDGKTLVASSSRGHMLVFDTTNWNVRADIERPKTPGFTGYRRLAVSPDGSLIATALGADKPTAELWSVATGKMHKLTTEMCFDIQFVADGSLVMSVADKNRLLAFSDPKTIDFGPVPSPLDTSPKELFIGTWAPGIGANLDFRSDGSLKIGSDRELAKWKFVSEDKTQANLLVTMPSGNEVTFTLRFKNKNSVNLTTRFGEIVRQMALTRIPEPVRGADGWFTCTSTTQGYSASFPGKPLGTLHFFTYRKKEEEFVIIAARWLESEGKIESELTSAAQKKAEEWPKSLGTAKILLDKEVEVNGHRGRRFSLQYPPPQPGDDGWRARHGMVVITGERRYILDVLLRDGAKVTQQDIDKFFASFRIHDP
ncbi:MAG: PD40 domain-containing protein, partial [Planctomycetes bacterium]|nr:PD40 domain-containing protein [Planctomycetota bacterium]